MATGSRNFFASAWKSSRAMSANRAWDLHPNVRQRLARSLDLIVNSSGLTDFNPDLREALAMNVRATVDILDFVRDCDHAALLHLSTCYVVGRRDGRILENLPKNYIPAPIADFDAEKEWQSLENLVREIPKRARSRPKSPRSFAAMRSEREHAAKDLQGAALG